MKFEKLFEPVQIGKVAIKNRIAMAPMGIVGLVNPDGSPTQRAIDYYIERARGNVGLIITSLFKVENEIEAMVGNIPMISRKSVIPFPSASSRQREQAPPYLRVSISRLLLWNRTNRLLASIHLWILFR